MELYFIRHGIAEDRSKTGKDFDRILTEIGRKKTEKIAQKLAQMRIHFNVIVSSPLLRAKETANLLLAQKLGEQLLISPHLRPEGNLQEWLQWYQKSPYQRENHRLALVGHEPNLSQWAEELLWGKSVSKITLKKAGIIALKAEVKQGLIQQTELFLLISPKWMIDEIQK